MNTENLSQETQPEFDIAAASADISSELFGQSGEAEDAKPSPAEGEGQSASSESSSAVEKADSPQENSEAVQATGAPKTWTKEALEKWATIDPVVQQEILKREEDALRGIQQYKAGAELGQRYDSVVEPFKPILQAENIDPVQLFQSFAANHYLLSRGTPQQKLELAANLISGYGIPFADLASYIGNSIIEAPDPQISALQNELNNLKAQLAQGSQAQQQQVFQAAAQTVDEFAKDPAHPYFEEVSEDIAVLLEGGRAKDLKEAYEMAVYANPQTRQKELARIKQAEKDAAAAEEKARRSKISASTGDHVLTGQRDRDGTVPVGSMDDTLNATLSAIRSRE